LVKISIQFLTEQRPSWLMQRKRSGL
jgi:hypothetical protein